MKSFLDSDFLLKTETSRVLYHEYAEHLPIIDYHCHINPMDILHDTQYHSITDLWLGGDHYKWRAMRSCGIAEAYITGKATSEEKFNAWAAIMPKLIGNPLYHWTHMELQRFFNITDPLNASTAARIYEQCNTILADRSMSVRNIIRKANVKLICTTDDPVDNLSAHRQLADDANSPAVVLPTFRPDKAMRADRSTFPAYVNQLEQVVGYAIDNIQDMRRALNDRMDYFASHGCRVSDHALDYCFYVEADEPTLNDIFLRAKSGERISTEEQLAYHTAMLISVGKEYSARDWVCQLHFGCLRDNSSKMFQKLGADTGFDSMNDASNAAGLTNLLNALECNNALGKTILYSLNPADNGIIASIMGAFQTDGPSLGRIQQGSAWWFNDHKLGMEAQMTSLMSLGVFGNFIGMLTDSRSFLSYTRHEYFRRILCNLLGQMVEDGEYPNDMDMLGKLVEDVCYYNTLKYFRFDELLN